MGSKNTNECRSQRITHYWKSITALGDGLIIFLVCLLFIHTTPSLLCILLCLLTTRIIKAWVKSPRPQGRNLIPMPTDYSFPSGHSSMSMIVYGAWAIEQHQYLWIAILMSIMVGFSRVALGVHWFGDILFGWLIGAFFLILLV